MSNETTGPVAVLLLPRLNLPLISFAKAVHDRLSGNPSFPSPNPSLAVLAADIAAFEDAETQTLSRTRGAAQLRDARRRNVTTDLAHLRDYVQGVAEKQPSRADAIALIESTLLSVKKSAKRSKAALSVKNKGVSGIVVLHAKAVAKVAIYYWQYSLDQETWTGAPETVKANTVIAGLIRAQTYYFRFRAVTSAREIGFSQVVGLLVH